MMHKTALPTAVLLRFLFLSGALLSVPDTAAAQIVNPADKQPSTGTLSGTVRDQQKGAIQYAVVDVSCGSARRRLAADVAGEFRASGLPAGRCTVSAESELFAAETVEIDLSGGATTVELILRVRRFASEVVVTAMRGVGQESFYASESISVMTREDLSGRPFERLAEALREEPGILLQQTTSAQASPIIRGFTGQSNVYLFDGVRFNNASWRSGPSQYLAWIDAATVDRLEIVRGPGSVQYGSDALGGTINVVPNLPSLAVSGVHVAGDVEAAFASAAQSAAGRVNLVVQGPTAAFRIGAHSQRVRDLRPGRGIDSHAAVTRFLGLPSTVVGNRLPSTGYDQSGASVVGNIRLGEATAHVVYVHENQTGVNRYDRIDGGDGLYRSGFEPQQLDFGFVRFQRQSTAGFDELSGTLSVNRQVDGRFEQTRPTAVTDRQRAATMAVGYQVEGRRRLSRLHLVTAGAEFYDESIGAWREQSNPLTGAIVPNRPDVPDATGYSSLGVFIQDSMQLPRVRLHGGLRFGRFGFSSVPDAAFGVTGEHITQQSVTFNAGAVVPLTRQVNATFNVGRGFRAANAADFGSVGLTGGSGFEIAPSRAAALGGLVGSTGAVGATSTNQAVPQLGPEVAYSFEPGFKFRTERFGASIAAYDIEFLDSIQRRAIVFPTDVVGTAIAGFQVVRQDATGLAYIAQDVRPITTRVNVDRARLRGFEVDGHERIAREWSARAFFSMTNGRLSTTGEYLRRMPPPMGAAFLRWTGKRVWVEGAATFARDQRRFNSGDLTDARIGAARTRTSIASYFNGTATDVGLVVNGRLVATNETLAQVQNRILGAATSAPMFDEGSGFVTLGVRAGFSLTSQFQVTLIWENLTDRNYRLYGSGVDAPGRNFQLRVRYLF